MTPAITALKKSAVSFEIHTYDVVESNEQTYGERVAQAIGMSPDRVFKTLIVALESGELIVAVVPVCGLLDLRSLAMAAKAKKASMAETTSAQKATGYVVGGISPFGQRQRLRAFVDESVRQHDSICVSAGRRGLQLKVAPSDLVELTNATVTALTKELGVRPGRNKGGS